MSDSSAARARNDGIEGTDGALEPTPAKPLPFPGPANANPRPEEMERNPVYDALAGDETSLVGLVAYALYKQNKRSWLDEFVKATKRPPTDDETRAYIIGESTTLRLETYRQLAAAKLSGVPLGQKAEAPGRGARIAFAVLAIVVAAIVVAVALRQGFGTTLVSLFKGAGATP